MSLKKCNTVCLSYKSNGELTNAKRRNGTARAVCGITAEALALVRCLRPILYPCRI